MGYENCCFSSISIYQHAQTPTPPDEAAGFPPCTSKEKKEGESQSQESVYKAATKSKASMQRVDTYISQQKMLIEYITHF